MTSDRLVESIGGSMEFCVLGLLLLRDMTIYDLNKEFAESLSLFYSASLGSLQTAIRNLLKAEKIAWSEAFTGKRRKKVYRILASGRAAFFGEMMSEIPRSKLETTALARTFFLGLIEKKEDRVAVLTSIVDATREELTGLRAMQTDLQKLELPEPGRETFAWQIRTLDYGVMAHEAGLRWFEQALSDASEDKA